MCPDPVAAVTAQQIALLDPTGARTRLFSPKNADRARVGDVLLVRLRSGEPVAGVCMRILRRGQDTAVHLRNTLTRVGVETTYKVYSPKVVGIEVVRRAQRKIRRARLYYLRDKKHDVGSVDKVVAAYLKKNLSFGRPPAKKAQDADKKGGSVKK